MEVEEAVAPARIDTDAPPRRSRAVAGQGPAAIAPTGSVGPAAIAIVTFATLSIYCACRSQGFISGDACIHYFSARYAFAHPRNFVDVWSRPLVTALYAVPAWLGGRGAIRVVSMLVAVGCGLVSSLIARGQGLALPVLALIFTLGQPLLFLHSFSEMTELPFALLLGLSFLAWQQRRFWLASLLVAWTPLARPEGFGIVAVVVLGLALARNWKQIFLLPLPVLLWDVAGWLLSDRQSPWWRWLKDNWPYAGDSLYGHGNILTFVALLPMVVSPLVLPGMILGMWLSLSHWRCISDAGRVGSVESEICPAEQTRHLRLCRILTAALPLFVLTAHSLLYWRGKMASSGEPRYLIIAAPFWGVLAASGWEWAFARLRWKNVIPWAAGAVLAPVGVNFIHPAVPVPFWHDWESAREISAWYRASPLRATHRKIATSHPGVYYFLDVNPYQSPEVQAWGRETMRQRPADTLLIWDPIFGGKNACAELALQLDDIRRAGWVEVDAPHPAEPEGDIAPEVRANPADPRIRWHVFVRGEVRP